MIGIVVQVLDIYAMVVLASALVTWLPIDRSNALVRLLSDVTEPLCAPFRQLIPPSKTGGLDFSVMFLLLAINVLKQILIGL